MQEGMRDSIFAAPSRLPAIFVYADHARVSDTTATTSITTSTTATTTATMIQDENLGLAATIAGTTAAVTKGKSAS
jgi:hypothetical protein